MPPETKNVCKGKVSFGDSVDTEPGKTFKCRIRIADKMANVSYILRDKLGKIKPLFVANKKGKRYMREHKIFDLTTLPEKILAGLGSFQNEMNISNLITNTGFAGVASRINGSGAEAAFTYIATGTGTTAANVADTTLETEITTGGGERAAATASRVTTDVTDDTAQLVNTFAFTSSFAVTESGVLNAASVGVLLARQVFSAINVVNGDSLQVTWKFDVD